MTEFIEKLLMIYGIVAALAIVIYPFICKKREKIVEVEKSENSCERWKSVFNAIMMIFMLIIGIILFVFVLKEKMLLVLVPFTVLTILEKTNEAYASISVIRETISSKGSEELTKRESDAIIMLATALLMLNLYKMPQKIIEVSSGITNSIVADWVMIVSAIFITTLYVFLIGVLGIIPIKAFVSLVRWIKKLSNPEKIKTIEKEYRYSKEKLIDWEFFSIRLIEWTLLQKDIAKILWAFCVILVPLDLILKLICLVGSTSMTILSYTYYLLRRINKSLILFSRWLESILERKVINIIFRASFVISVTLIVLVNRYCQCLKVYENSTGGFEFIASAIVIPLIFSWIMEYKSSVEK